MTFNQALEAVLSFIYSFSSTTVNLFGQIQQLSRILKPAGDKQNTTKLIPGMWFVVRFDAMLTLSILISMYNSEKYDADTEYLSQTIVRLLDELIYTN